MQSKDFYCASNKLEKLKCKSQCLDCKGYGEKPKLYEKTDNCAGCGKIVSDCFLYPPLCWDCYSNKH